MTIKKLADVAVKEILTVRQFAEACRYLTNEDIYTLFEDTISQDLRNKIYSHSVKGAPEPARSALNKVGAEYAIPSLMEF